jgi:hypothetical protein
MAVVTPMKRSTKLAKALAGEDENNHHDGGDTDDGSLD